MLQHLCFSRTLTSLLRVNFHSVKEVLKNDFYLISKKIKPFPALEFKQWLLIACLLNLSCFCFSKTLRDLVPLDYDLLVLSVASIRQVISQPPHRPLEVSYVSALSGKISDSFYCLSA